MPTENVLVVGMQAFLKDFDVQMNFDTKKISFSRGVFSLGSDESSGGSTIIVIIVLIVVAAIIVGVVMVCKKKRDSKLNYQLARGSNF